MPRQAAAASGFAARTNASRMLEAARGSRTALERETFLDIVLGAPAAPFHAVRSAVARRLCEGHRCRRRSRAGELAAAYVVDDKPSPWLPVWQASIRAVTTLARMLALSPGGRVPSKSAEAQEPVSYYSRLALEAKRR